MKNLSKLTKDQLQKIRDAKAEKLAFVQANPPLGNREDVARAFNKIEQAFSNELAEIDAELAKR